LSFTKSNCRDFIATDEDPNSPDFIPRDYQVWGDAEVLSQAATEAKKQFPSLEMHFS